MARIIGGLTSSLLLTLILVPVVYVKVDQWRESIPAFFKKLLKQPVKKKTTVALPDIAHASVEFGKGK